MNTDSTETGLTGSPSAPTTEFHPPTPAVSTSPSPAAQSSETASSASAAPRVRWAAIIWGMLLAASAGAMIWILTTADRREELVQWFAGLTPEALGAIALFAVGVLVLVCGTIGLIRRAQHQAASRRAQGDDTLV